jgi:hypothetical protein
MPLAFHLCRRFQKVCPLGTPLEALGIMENDPSRAKHDRDAAVEPPASGRTTQESMREAAHRPVAGPASSDRLAAGGGLEIPDAPEGQPFHEHGIHETGAMGLIPGAREPSNLTHREPGAISGQFNGSDIPAVQTDLLNEAEKIESYREGGLDRGSATRKARNDDGK